MSGVDAERTRESLWAHKRDQVRQMPGLISSFGLETDSNP